VLRAATTAEKSVQRKERTHCSDGERFFVCSPQSAAARPGIRTRLPRSEYYSQAVPGAANLRRRSYDMRERRCRTSQPMQTEADRIEESLSNASTAVTMPSIEMFKAYTRASRRNKI